MTTSFTKTVAAALTVIVVSGSFASHASASDRGFAMKPGKHHSRGAAVAGALLGIGGALLGAAIVHHHARAAEPRRGSFHDVEPRHHGYGLRMVRDEQCFEKPIRRFDRYSGEMVVVGYKSFCR